jgi:hypothetical protein
MASSTAPHSEKQGEQQEKRIQRKAQKHEMGNTKIAIKPHSRNVTNFIFPLWLLQSTIWRCGLL